MMIIRQDYDFELDPDTQNSKIRDPFDMILHCPIAFLFWPGYMNFVVSSAELLRQQLRQKSRLRKEKL